MITQAEIDDNSNITKLLESLSKIPGICKVEAIPIEDPTTSKHPEFCKTALDHDAKSIHFIGYVDRKDVINDEGNYLHVFYPPRAYFQQIGFAMPPSLYNNYGDGHDLILKIMRIKVSEYIYSNKENIVDMKLENILKLKTFSWDLTPHK